MAVRNPTKTVSVNFQVGHHNYPATAQRGNILHQVLHVALPEILRTGHRLTFRAPSGNALFADNFVGDLEDAYGEVRVVTEATPIAKRCGPWRNIGFDHLAITVSDRAGARDFFHEVLRLEVMRDDAHLTVLTTGPTALFLFDAGPDAPLSSGEPSKWHHLGFVVDDLEAAYDHLTHHGDLLSSDFTLLEREERWSLYFTYQNGDVKLLIQLSEIKSTERGFTDLTKRHFPDLLYDYASRPYGQTLPGPWPDHLDTSASLGSAVEHDYDR
ncbi:MAG: VOC family protein [Chloroflexota bacterium]|nr:VOC family protein [Chloroflexota bacterium]